MSEDLLRRAWQAYQAGSFVDAGRLYEDILRADPRQFDALYLLGFVHLALQNREEAERLFSEALRVDPASPHALLALGTLLLDSGRREESIAYFDRFLTLDSANFDAHYFRAIAFLGLGRYADAVGGLDRALALEPTNVLAITNRAFALLELKRLPEAVAGFDRTLALEPKNFVAWINRGAAQLEMRKYPDALASLDEALSLDPGSVGALNNRGQALQGLGRHEDALLNFDTALAIEPTSADVRVNRAGSLYELSRHEEAAREYEELLQLDPNYKYARGCLAHCRRLCCEWENLADDREQMARGLQRGKRVVSPFMYLPVAETAEEQRNCATVYARNEYPPAATPRWRGERYHHDRIRIAYISADFRPHPVSFLLAPVFEQHDRRRFEIFAMALNAEDGSEIQKRVRRASEHFAVVGSQSDDEIASRLRRLEIDIAVDLMGFSGLCRSGIFASRPAPVQVNYLGMASTMGADYIDYLLADPTVIPLEHQRFYREKLAHLPGCYLPADAARPIGVAPSRSEAGLPEAGFVFCSFNNSYKFTPVMFGLWMRLLRAVPDSVLWLPASNPAAMRNLQREAEAAGVSSQRLIFAPFVSGEENHIARLKCADLFLDTLPYNAHTSAIDALLAGLPVLTCLGQTFPGRVAASVLRAAGLPELIADKLETYESMALMLAREPARLAALKAKIARISQSASLFDSKKFTANLEAAFTKMWQRQQRGEPPELIAVG